MKNYFLIFIVQFIPYPKNMIIDPFTLEFEKMLLRFHELAARVFASSTRVSAVTHFDDSIESPTRDLTGKTRCLSIDGNHVPIKMIRVVRF